MIPGVIDHKNHGVHLEPCYKKFTLILSKKKSTTNQEKRSSMRLSSPPPSEARNRWVYPKECNICKQYKIQFKGKSVYPQTIEGDDAIITIKTAAKEKDLAMYYEIKDMDLPSKEFKYHQTPCYRDFTRGYNFKGRILESNSDSASSEQSNNVLEGIDSSITWQFGNFEAVEQYISDHVILKNQAISMRISQEIYGLRPDDARYRNQLKKRIVSAYGDKLSFLTAKKIHQK